MPAAVRTTLGKIRHRANHLPLVRSGHAGHPGLQDKGLDGFGKIDLWGGQVTEEAWELTPDHLKKDPLTRFFVGEFVFQYRKPGRSDTEYKRHFRRLDTQVHVPAHAPGFQRDGNLFQMCDLVRRLRHAYFLLFSMMITPNKTPHGSGRQIPPIPFLKHNLLPHEVKLSARVNGSGTGRH
jgi:hypothetical protein